MARTASDGISDTTPASVKLETRSLPYLRGLSGGNVSVALRRVTRDHLTAARILCAGLDDAETVAKLRDLLLPKPTTNEEPAAHGPQTA